MKKRKDAFYTKNLPDLRKKADLIAYAKNHETADISITNTDTVLSWANHYDINKDGFMPEKYRDLAKAVITYQFEYPYWEQRTIELNRQLHDNHGLHIFNHSASSELVCYKIEKTDDAETMDEPDSAYVLITQKSCRTPLVDKPEL